MDAVPDTVRFLALGYGVIFGVMAVYLGTLVARFRNLRQDEKTLDELERKQ